MVQFDDTHAHILILLQAIKSQYDGRVVFLAHHPEFKRVVNGGFGSWTDFFLGSSDDFIIEVINCVYSICDIILPACWKYPGKNWDGRKKKEGYNHEFRDRVTCDRPINLS